MNPFPKLSCSPRQLVSHLAQATLLLSLASGCGKAAAGVDAGVVDAGGTSCDGVTGPCLANEGSTMYEDVRVQETPIPSLAADVLLTEGAAVAGEQVDVAFLNGGDFRAGVANPDFTFSDENARIGKKYLGAVSQVDMEGWFPFPEGMVVMTLNGSQIRRALESGVRSFADSAQLSFGPDLLNDKGGWLLHVAGMSYEVNCPGTTRMVIGPQDCDPYAGTCVETNAAQANTVSRIQIGNTVILENGQWVAGGNTRTFRAILPDFIAQGLDGHLAFKEGTNQKTILQNTWDFHKAVAKYVIEHSPLMLPALTGRMTIKGTVGGLACNLPQNCLPAHKSHPNCAHLH